MALRIEYIGHTSHHVAISIVFFFRYIEAKADIS